MKKRVLVVEESILHAPKIEKRGTVPGVERDRFLKVLGRLAIVGGGALVIEIDTLIEFLDGRMLWVYHD